MVKKGALCLTFLLALTLSLFSQGLTIRIVKKQDIFEKANFKACHASTIVALSDKKLMAAWFGGDHEGSADVCIWAAFYNKGKWTEPVIIADGVQPNGKQYACWNPVLFKAGAGQLYLHYKVGPNPREWWAMYKSSGDGGKTWSIATRLPDGFLGPVKNKPMQLANGNILYPSSTESLDEKTWQIHLELSDRQLKNWKRIPIECDTFQTIQPSLLRYSANKLQLLARSKENVIVQSWSYNNGLSWEKVTKTNLPNPNSGSDAATFKGMQLLVYNPLTAGKNWWEGRSVLKMAASADGRSWKNELTFEDEKQGEFSYPAIIADDTGNVFITYTSNRSRIKFVWLKIN